MKKCYECDYNINNGETFIELEEGTVLCESCFYNFAVKKCRATVICEK